MFMYEALSRDVTIREVDDQNPQREIDDNILFTSYDCCKRYVLATLSSVPSAWLYRKKALLILVTIVRRKEGMM